MTEQTPYRLQRRTSLRNFVRWASEALGICFVGFNWLVTQHAAAAMHYPAFLNGRIVGHLYQPLAWWWWQSHWPYSALRIGHRIILLQPMWRACERQVVFPMVALGAIAALYAALLAKQRTPADLHGSATWASAQEIKRAGLL